MIEKSQRPHAPASVVVTEDRQTRLRQAIEKRLSPTELLIIDQTHLHAGHAGASDGRGHFKVRIVSELFNDVPRARRHQMVYEAVGELLSTDIHALSIQATTPAEARDAKA